MFWSGNYIAVRELNSLLKEENVSLSQVLEADDILQECKADNKALIQFLTRPEILADLITLITEEPPKNVELASQYRHANIACEVLTSHLSMLSDRLSLDAAQMNRLCDFLNQDPPLNPLLASYFSKTVEMLLEKSPKQDWCLHHIVCLRVLDFFKSRRDFLPNLLRHMSTSAIADIFKYLMRIDDLIKTVMEWLEEHQFLECLIQIICGTYVPEVFPPHPGVAPQPEGKPEPVEKAERETSEKPEANHTDDKDSGGVQPDSEKETSKPVGEAGDDATHGESTPPIKSQTDMTADNNAKNMSSKSSAEAEAEAEAERAAKAVAAERIAAAASANAAALLCDLIVNGCRGRSGWSVSARGGGGGGVAAALGGERGVQSLLGAMFTSAPRARRHALVNGAHVLLALLHHDTHARMEKEGEDESGVGVGVGPGGCGGSERCAVELGVAPHLPLLHHALLHQVPPTGGVGLARVQLAALLAHLALSEVEEVATTMLTLGTPGVLVDMFFEYPNNNFLHAQVYTLIKHALSNRVYSTQYKRHLFVECDLLNRLMDLFEENKNNKSLGVARSAHMGHALQVLALAARALHEGEAGARWAAFLHHQLRPTLEQHDTPLGGYYPSENFYDVEIMPDSVAASYDFNDMNAAGTIVELTDDINADDVNDLCGGVGSSIDSPDFIADGLGIRDNDKLGMAKNNFLELASQRFDDDMWEDSGDAEGDVNELNAPADVRDVLDQHSPWESADSGSGGGEGWASFTAGGANDPFAPSASPPAAPPAPPAQAPHSPTTPPADDHFAEFTPFWSYDTQHEANSTSELESNLRSLRLEGELSDKRMDEASSVELANNLLTAMSAMSPDAIANIVNANLPPTPPSPTASPTPSPPGGAQDPPSGEHR